MTTETMIMTCLTILFGLVQTAFWRWVTNVEKARDKDGEKIESLEREVSDLRAEMYQKYQSKDDWHRDVERIMKTLDRIEHQIDKLDEKLDKKADK